MNLIEQLGGYEKAKAKYDMAVKLDYQTINVPVEMGFADVHVSNLKLSLLEYRREHGIFEVGDQVVLIKGNRALLVMFIVEVKTRTLCIKNRGGATIIFNKLHIRHATDEEIASGNRL